MLVVTPTFQVDFLILVSRSLKVQWRPRVLYGVGLVIHKQICNETEENISKESYFIGIAIVRQENNDFCLHFISASN